MWNICKSVAPGKEKSQCPIQKKKPNILDNSLILKSHIIEILELPLKHYNFPEREEIKPNGLVSKQKAVIVGFCFLFFFFPYCLHHSPSVRMNSFPGVSSYLLLSSLILSFLGVFQGFFLTHLSY